LSTQTIDTAPDSVKNPPFADRLRAHVAIMRLDHSIKNIFVLPGIIVPLSVLRTPLLTPSLVRNIVVGFVATTLIACSNYVLNEVLDAPFDRLHPTKKSRPAAQGLVIVPLAYVQWILMMAAGIVLRLQSRRSLPIPLPHSGLWVLLQYPPFRTKDKVYLDVLSESVNNPLRLLLGWFMVTSVLIPPLSLLLSYWMVGCYLMALKRFSEYREIGDTTVAGSYRRSFQYYSEVSLLASVMFYASSSMLFLGAFIIRYRIELIFGFPLVALLMATYFRLAFQPNSSVQNPEKLYREPVLMAETVLMTGLMIVLLYVDIPMMKRLFPATLQ